MKIRDLVIMFLAGLILLGGSGEALAQGIYGDRYPVEALYPYNPLGWGGFSYKVYETGTGVFVHVIGDSLATSQSRELFGMSLGDLDEKTRQEGLFCYESTYLSQPILLISAQDQTTLEKMLMEDKDLQALLEAFWQASVSNVVRQRDIRGEQDTLWVSSGHRSRVFPGLFTNPPYKNRGLFLLEDAQTEITEQVRQLASLLNDQQDISTVKEIYNLIIAVVEEGPKPNVPIFELTASYILSNGVAVGCTHYAVAFATLARAKGIPAVIVDAAKLGWIQRGCSLHLVEGHFFVEVHLKGTWYLVDSTAGILYENYDRGNWYLPNRYVAFAKALSVIDTGATERTHNLLQRVAFLAQTLEYEEPNCSPINLRDSRQIARLRQRAQKLAVKPDPRPLVYTREGAQERIAASPKTIDFTAIPISADLIPPAVTENEQDPVGKDFEDRLDALERLAEEILKEIQHLKNEF